MEQDIVVVQADNLFRGHVCTVYDQDKLNTLPSTGKWSFHFPLMERPGDLVGQEQLIENVSF